MKIKADYASAPQWKELAVKSKLPENTSFLERTLSWGRGLHAFLLVPAALSVF